MRPAPFWNERYKSSPPSTIRCLFLKCPAEAWLMRKTMTRHMTGCFQSCHISSTKKGEGGGENPKPGLLSSAVCQLSICVYSLGHLHRVLRDDTRQNRQYERLHTISAKRKRELKEQKGEVPNHTLPHLDVVSNFGRSSRIQVKISKLIDCQARKPAF